MKNVLYGVACLALGFVFSCEDKDDVVLAKTDAIYGEWELHSWSVGIGFDADGDGAYNENLIAELACDNHEVLLIENTGVLSFNNVYNPEYSITKDDEENYNINASCDDEGHVGLATSFEYNHGVIVYSEARQLVLDNGVLISVFEDAVAVYALDDDDHVLETRHLTKIYTKKRSEE